MSSKLKSLIIRAKSFHLYHSEIRGGGGSGEFIFSRSLEIFKEYTSLDWPVLQLDRTKKSLLYTFPKDKQKENNNKNILIYWKCYFVSFWFFLNRFLDFNTIFNDYFCTQVPSLQFTYDINVWLNFKLLFS